MWAFRVVSRDSLDKYMSSAVTHYSSLFTLPSHSKLVLSLIVLCMLSGGSAIIPLSQSHQTLALGISFGVTLFLVTVLSDFIISRSYMKADPILNSRRCSALSVFSWLIWFCFMFLGNVASIFVESLDLWVKLFFLGLCPVLILRLLVYYTTSFTSYDGVFISSTLQPAVCTVSFLFIGPLLGYTVEGYLLLFPLLSILVAVVTVFLFTFLLDRMGKTAVGIASLTLFKAFLANWTTDVNEPLEEVFEELGVEKDIEASLLGFRAKKKMKAVMAVPACHRGPFRNIGSSLLPYTIQESLGNELQCVVTVPHGLFGHETDLSSQLQNRKVVEGILHSVNSFSSLGYEATPFVRVQKNGAGASCQIFDLGAVFTLTLAPQTTEDLPEELDSMIADEAAKAGISSVLVINAHNSIEGASEPNEKVDLLREVAVASLRKAQRGQQLPLEIGASTIIPEEFGLKEGMGPGGISVIAAKVGGQKAAYITIDGNNMVSGLRERILSMLPEMGVTEGEVLTTDTHAVNGVVRTARGYYPVGEAMDKEKVIDYIRKAVTEAVNNAEPVEALWASEVVPSVKVIGREQIVQLCSLAGKTLSRAKKLAVLLFSSVGVLLTALILFL